MGDQQETTPTSREFSGQVAIVTGSTSGIGEATARRLISLGAQVMLNS
ncbi:MAG: SDR family NAD(P)-dependent oxidoreductase, partial [Acidimicrobiales bacterium]